jgi:CubicO group peptidase (beta-lactamase class C family)
MMSIPRLRFAALVLILFFVRPATAQSGPPTDLDSYVARDMKTFDVPGIAIAIVKDGKVVLAKGYGVRKLGEAAAVDENTLFGIGSNTKAFTSAALASLVDAGKISWDDKVYERLKGFQMYDPYVSHEMTIRDLLTHRSGMGLGEGDLLFWPHTTFTREDIIYRLRFMKPASSFRSHYAYDNLMNIAAGQIIPAVTGESWEKYIREKILEPLGMKTTNLSTTAFKPSDDYAWPHSKIDGKLQTIPFQDLDNAAPAGAINSSVAEMAKWIMLQLNHGKFPGREDRLFSEAQSREMWTAQTLTPIGTGASPTAALRPQFAAYALGWGIRDYHGRRLVGHTGGVSGFVSRVIMAPEESLGMVILTNAEQGGAFDSIMYHVLDAYFELPPMEWTASFKAAEDESEKAAKQAMAESDKGRATNSKPSLPVEKFAGVYNDAWYGPITIKQEGSGLVFSMNHTPKAVADLQHWQYDTFKAHWRDQAMEDAFVTFSLNPDGSINHFTMAAVSPLADFSFDYQDLWFTPELPHVQ